MKGEVALATAIVFFFHYRIWAVLLTHLNFSFFYSLSFRLSNETHLSYTVTAQGYRMLGVFAVEHSLHPARISFCFGGGLKGIFCVFFCFGFFWGRWVCSFGLFVYLFGGVGFGEIWLVGFVCLFGFFCFAVTLPAFLLFWDELITSYWWGVVHCDMQFFTMTYKSSLAELQSSPVPSEVFLLVLIWKTTCNYCDHRRFQGTLSTAALYLLASISPSCFEHWIAEL